MSNHRRSISATLVKKISAAAGVLSFCFCLTCTNFHLKNGIKKNVRYFEPNCFHLQKSNNPMKLKEIHSQLKKFQTNLLKLNYLFFRLYINFSLLYIIPINACKNLKKIRKKLSKMKNKTHLFI